MPYQTVKNLFESYMTFAETRGLEIDMYRCSPGICVENYDYNITYEPHLRIGWYGDDEIPAEPHLIEELNDILDHTGPYLHTLKYKSSYNSNHRSTIPDVPTQHEYVIDKVLHVCHNLRELYVDGIQLKCSSQSEKPHNMLKTIKIGGNNVVSDGFFQSLPSRLPNLNCMTLYMNRNMDHMEMNDIQMPSTKFTKLSIILPDCIHGRFSEDYTLMPVEEEFVIGVTTKGNSVPAETRFYHCISQQDHKNYLNELILVRERGGNELGNYTVNTSSSVELRITLNITCFSIETLYLNTDSTAIFYIMDNFFKKMVTDGISVIHMNQHQAQ